MQESINLARGLIIPIILHLLVMMIPTEALEKTAHSCLQCHNIIFQQRNYSSNYGRGTGPGDDHSARVLWIKSSQALTRQSYILLSSKNQSQNLNLYQYLLGGWKMSAEHLVEVSLPYLLALIR